MGQLGGWSSIFLGTYISYFVSTNILSWEIFVIFPKKNWSFFFFFGGVILLISIKKIAKFSILKI
jgi:hypothetical protein